MKYISNRNIGWLAGFLLTACQSEVVTVPDNDNALQVLSVGLNQDEGTRSEMTTDEIKQINVYTTTNAHAEITTNTLATYTNDGNAWSCDAPPELTAALYNIFAYYPPKRVDSGEAVTVTNSTTGEHTIKVYIYAEDDFGSPKQDDYLYNYQTDKSTGNYEQITASTASKTVSFSMNHALSKVSFQITKDASATEKLTLTQIDIIGKTNSLQTGTGDMYLKTGGLVGLQSKDQISLTGSVALQNTLTSPNITALVAPMSKEEKVLSFRLTVNVDGVSRVFETGTVKDDASNWPGVKWLAGKHYVYKIKVSKMGGVINGVSVYDWQKDSDQNTQVGI